MNLGKFSVTNPVLVNIAMVAILVLGAVSLIRLPREAFSDVDFSWVFIAVPYPGASAEQIEKSVVVKVEDEIADVDRVKRVTSTAEQGVAFFQVEFDEDLARPDFLRLFQDLRTEFEKVTLPDGTMDPWIEEFTTADFMPIVTVNIKGEVNDDVINRTARGLRERILDIDDVSKAEVVGGREREIWIEADRDRLEAFGVSLDEVINAVRYRNMNIPGGTLETPTRKYLLQVLGEIKDGRRFGDVIVRRRPGQGSIEVNDVATVNEGLARSRYDVRFDGEKAVSLLVSKKNKGNAIRVVDEVHRLVDAHPLPDGISVHYFNDTSLMIRDVVDILSKNALMGFVTLVLVLFAFIGLRNALVTALGIPITFAISFLFMEWYGESLNGNSLFALVMVLGMIVDHAIVIIENSYRHRQMGLDAAQAAIVGTNEVVRPVIAGTLTTVAAFLPLMLLPGIMGKFMRIIPIVVSLALVASTLEALFFLPSHFAEWGSKAKEFKEGFVGRRQDSFRRLVSAVYRRRYLTAGLTIAGIVLSMFMVPFVKQDLFAGEEFTQFFVDITLPIGTPRSVTNEVASRFESTVLPGIGKGEIVSVTTQVGFMATDDDWITASHVAQLTVDVAERREGRTRPIREIMADAEKECGTIPGAEKVNYRMVNNGPPQDLPVTLRLQGDNYADMASIANDIVRTLQKDDRLFNVGHDYVRGHPELRISINEERASELGLSVGQIGLYLRNAFEGADVTKFFEEDEEIDVKVRFAEPYRASVADVNQLKFPTPDGRLVPFSTVCSLEHGTGVAAITRLDGTRKVEIFADAREGVDGRQTEKICADIIAQFGETYGKTYPGITIHKGGQFADFNRVLADVMRLLFLGLFLMYVILGAQFKSYLQPLIIGTALFFAAVGCILFLVVSRTAFSVVVMFAGVALAGICVNDSIVLVSFVNSLRRKGMATGEAVVEGAAVRLRPIILTSVTTIGGLFPMAIGLGGRSDMWAPMASTIIFGLFFSTVGTLIVIPCFYGILDDITAKLGGKMRLEGE